MNRDTVRQILVIVGVVATLAVNGLSESLPINGQTSADIANRFNNNYFLPANYVFGIWGLIYLGLIAYAIYQALPAQRENPRLRRIAYPFLVTCVANCVWLFLFHYEQFWMSTVAMLILLAALVVIYLRLRTGNPANTAAERWAVRVPFSIYLGWITVATVANFSYAILTSDPASINQPNAAWLGIGYATWGAIMIVVGAAIAGVFAWLNRDIAYAAVIVWAFVGIIARFPDVGTIVLPAAVMTAVVGLAALASVFLRGGARRGGGLTPTRA